MKSEELECVNLCETGKFLRFRAHALLRSLLPSLLQGKMVGKRPRQMQRTVSVSMMGPESILSEFPMLPEYPKEKQNPHVEVPACYLHGKSIVSNNNPDSDPENAHLFISHVESEACYAEHVLPFAFEANHSRPRPWEIREDGAVGLSIVAALHGIDPDITTGLKDSRDETSPTAVMTNTLVHQNLLPSVHQFWTSLTPTAQQQQQHHEMELQGNFCGHVTAVSGSLRGAVPNVSPEVHFLEVCCYCRRRLSHGRDIYMYRGDEAFCSEECRHQQILIDERQKKCSLTALKGRTAAQPAHPAGQQSQAMATGAAAAG